MTEEENAPEKLARYSQTEQHSAAGEVIFELRMYTDGILDHTMTVSESLLHFELNALRKKGYALTEGRG